MPALIACLSTGKGTWAQVSRIISRERWSKVILITNDFGKEKFTANAEFIVVDFDKESNVLVEQITSLLKGKAVGEVAVNLSSGAGKEHMAIISAVMKSGLSFRIFYFVYL